MKIPSSAFISAFALFICAINYRFFLFTKGSDLSIQISVFVLFFTLSAALFSLFFWRFTTKLFASIFAFVAILSAYFLNAYAVIIDKNMIRNVVNTDVKEALDLVNSSFILSLLAGVFVVLVIYLAPVKIAFRPFFREIWNRILFISLLLSAFALTFLTFSKELIPFFREHNEIRYSAVPFYPIYSTFRYLKLRFGTKPEFVQIGQDARLSDDEKRIFVLIIGETARAQNYAINGYTANDTTPYSRQNGLLSFENFYSCGTSTAISVPCMFSNLMRDNFKPESAKYSGNLLDVLSTAGVSISWFDNNSGSCQGVCARLNSVKDYGGDEPDAIMLKDVENALNSASGPSLIVVHLQGSHGPKYFERYPREFERFKPACRNGALQNCTSQEITNAYDNTILYTDFVVNEVLNSLKNTGATAALFYVSDHGESLGENGIYLHGLPYSLAPDVQKHVPALIWTSDQATNDDLSALKSAELRQDEFIFNSLLGYFRVNSSLYDAKFDIFKGRAR